MTVLDLSYVKAREYFMDPQCYGSTDLPVYFDFKPLLDAVAKSIGKAQLSKDLLNVARDTEGVNYTLIGNKDGKYSWRPLQFIHPVLYVELVNRITERSNWTVIKNRFNVFNKIEHIKCASLPVAREKKKNIKGELILNWWSSFEQQSIIKSLQYRQMVTTDITDCYGSIYTHSIAWALYGREYAKNNKDNKGLLGNIVDSRIRAMRYGQTNGIPQGSVLMDFIAELVLGYVDLQLDEKLREIGITDYYILRYRDDYRIFVNDTWLGEKILKELTVVLSGMGMRLNSSKTKMSGDVVMDSVKADKLEWFKLQENFNSLTMEKKLLLLYNHANKYPNGGSLLQPLIELEKEVCKGWHGGQEQILASAAVLIELAFRNPRCYQPSMSVMARLVDLLPDMNRHEFAKKVLEKFRHLPNTGYLQVWLQRIMKPSGIRLDYTERLCNIVDDSGMSLWENSWLQGDAKLLSVMENVDIVNRERLQTVKTVMGEEEINIFISNYQRNYQG